jgi:[ribosomal protein S5]-alanine N-acetyltransferase
MPRLGSVGAVQNTIVTNRLLLRPFELSDVEAAFQWFSDPEVMRFTPSGPDESLDHTKTRLAKYQEHQLVHGFSKWIVVDRGASRPIGDAGLLVLQDYDWIDFGYRIAQPYWGNGLATEAGTGWVRAAFDQFHINRLTAFVHPENVASIRVLHKLGFEMDRPETVMSMKSIVFYTLVRNTRTAADKAPKS